MTDISIDSSKLPGVKEVCRDFAVLEDHSLAHTLQEQEIEHHLATNVQRNRLVKHDLQVAKQLQEEEDLRAQAQNKHRHNELELLDSEIAQEIQEKLVIEAESRRRQEEKDEDIARLLQEREEKRRKKHYPPHATEEPYYPDHGGHHRDRHKEHMSEYDRSHRHERSERSRKEGARPKSKHPAHCDDERKRGRSAEPRTVREENRRDFHRLEDNIRTSKKDKPERPPPPRTGRHQSYDDEEPTGAHSSEYLPRRRSHSHDILSTNNADIRSNRDSPNPRSDRRGIESEHERQRKGAENEYDNERPRRRADDEYEHDRRRKGVGGEYENKGHRKGSEGEYEHKGHRKGSEGEYEHKGHRKGSEGEYEHKGHKKRTESEHDHERPRRKPPSPDNERLTKDGGSRPKGPRDVPQGRLRTGGRNRDEDAEIARKLQEEELRVNAVDYKAAQMAQDEEIARWLMEKEEKFLKKSKGRRRSDELEPTAHEHVRPRSKDEYHRSRSDKPYRPLPPPPDEEYNEDYSNDYTNRNSHSSPRPSSKSQSSHKGSHHRQ